MFLDLQMVPIFYGLLEQLPLTCLRPPPKPSSFWPTACCLQYRCTAECPSQCPPSHPHPGYHIQGDQLFQLTWASLLVNNKSPVSWETTQSQKNGTHWDPINAAATGTRAVMLSHSPISFPCPTLTAYDFVLHLFLNSFLKPD